MIKPATKDITVLQRHAHKISENAKTLQPLEMTAILFFEMPGKRN